MPEGDLDCKSGEHGKPGHGDARVCSLLYLESSDVGRRRWMIDAVSRSVGSTSRNGWSHDLVGSKCLCFSIYAGAVRRGVFVREKDDSVQQLT